MCIRDRDGTLGRIKAFILADMIGDKDLDIQRETRSSDWLVSLMTQAAKMCIRDRSKCDCPGEQADLSALDRRMSA